MPSLTDIQGDLLQLPTFLVFLPIHSRTRTEGTVRIPIDVTLSVNFPFAGYRIMATETLVGLHDTFRLRGYGGYVGHHFGTSDSERY
jgi:hypothetical protein